MLRNNKGFSLVELLAMVFITSVIIVPLMSTYVRNFELNDQQHTRRSALSIAQGTLYGFDKIDYTDLKSLVDTANSGSTYYIELNESTCSGLAATTDQSYCTAIFQSIHNNLTLSATTYRVFIFDYNMPGANVTALQANVTIPQQVRDEIGTLGITTGTNTALLRMVVWIHFENEPNLYVVLSGVLHDN